MVASKTVGVDMNTIHIRSGGRAKSRITRAVPLISQAVRVILLTLGIAAAGLLIIADTGLAQRTDARASTFFVGRLRYGNDTGDTCGGVETNMMNIVSQVSTIHARESKIVAATDTLLFETPFLFMNGHNAFVLSQAEIDNLRTYFEHGGFLFASECCNHPEFPNAWRREFSRIFAGEKVRHLPYDHSIYRAFYKIDDIKSLSQNRTIYLEGLFYHGRLVAVMCQDGLCCAFSANNTCNQGRGVKPEDGRRIALNVAVYALTH
jgi:hypothetical protein